MGYGINDFNHYQRFTDETAIYPERGTGSESAINYVLVSLAGESGSILNKWKKHLRGDFDLDEAIALIRPELGDVLYYVARAAGELGMTFAELAEQNEAKLLDRKRRGVLHGTGSNR